MDIGYIRGEQATIFKAGEWKGRQHMESIQGALAVILNPGRGGLFVLLSV
jgi:hypothetical protein